jgi:hypothetical protein
VTREEFSACMAYLAAAIQKPLPKESVAVYFDLLGDLQLAVLQTACKRVALEHRWATFPSVAEIREAAAETQRGQVKEIAPAEAWEMAWRAVGQIDPEVAGSADRALSRVPLIVAAAVVAMGIPALCYGKEPVGVIRGQFMKTFEQIAARDKRQALLPSTVKEAIAQHRPAIAQAVAQIGAMPDD